MKHKTSLVALFAKMKEHMALMAFSGIGGVLFRAVLAHVIDTMTGAGVISCLSAGFLMGSGGELAVKAMQDRLMARK